MCCGCPVNITRLMEDCYGLTGLKVNVDRPQMGFFFGGGGGQTVSLYSTYWCLWHTMRLTSFCHYYCPQVLSQVTPLCQPVFVLFFVWFFLLLFFFFFFFFALLLLLVVVVVVVVVVRTFQREREKKKKKKKKKRKNFLVALVS